VNTITRPVQCCRLQLMLPNGIKAMLAIPPCELKRILVSLDERDYIPKSTIEMLLLGLGLEDV
jgi:hypothetical protein